MRDTSELHSRAALGALIVLGACCLGDRAMAAPDYHPIHPTMANTTLTLTGHTLTIDQVIQVARYGAKINESADAKRRQEQTQELLYQAAREGLQIYGFNRNGGFLRQVARFPGNPMSPANLQRLEQAVLTSYKNGANAGDGPEIADEDIVRAIMLVYISELTYRPAGQELTQMMIDMLNDDITPVVKSRGGTGEAQGPAISNIDAAAVGAGEAYYHGVRMSAAAALQMAGLSAIHPAASNSAIGATNADVAGMGAVLVADAKLLLEWADLAYAIDLNGMNSSVTPLFAAVQANRPYKWINWEAARVLNMIKGSYLFDVDKTRILQDPESLRASYVRQGSAWEEWANLRDDVTVQMNWSDGNPATKPNVSPMDSWEFATPWAMQYYAKGGPEDHGIHGFIFANANWDPNPLGNRLEAFSIALANMDIAVLMRQERFENPFFTVIRAQDVLEKLRTLDDSAALNSIWNYNHEAWQRIQGLINPVPPEGYSSDPEYDEELDAETLFKVSRAVQVVDESWKLVASDFLNGARWLDVRKAQRQNRTFGSAPAAALAALRQVVPLQPRETEYSGPAEVALQFVKTTPAATFYSNGPAAPEQQLGME